jgi:hypothetical protein
MRVTVLRNAEREHALCIYVAAASPMLLVDAGEHGPRTNCGIVAGASNGKAG